jgi:hypothetical protein
VVEDHALDKVEQELPLRFVDGAGVPSGFRRRTELPDARVNEILVVGRSQGSGQPGLFPDEPFKLVVKSAVRRDLLFARHHIRRIVVNQPASLMIEGADLARDVRELPRGAPEP